MSQTVPGCECRGRHLFASVPELGHCHIDLSRACEGFASVADEHVVQNQNIAVLPGKDLRISPISIANPVEQTNRDRAAISEKRLPGKILFRIGSEQSLACGRVERGGVKKVGLVKP